jgi:moderate conductance mechanosensitive channel
MTIVESLVGAGDIWSLEWLRTNGVRIGLIVVLAAVVSRLGRLAVGRMRRGLEAPSDLTAPISVQRAATLTSMVTTTIRAVLWTVVLLLVLGELGISLGPLIASAGILGVALAFGAQSLVRDFLSGFFILLENQYAVGESVAVSAVGGVVEGRVESVTLRATSVRSTDGTLHVFSNGNVLLVANRSRGTGRFSVEIRLPAGADLEEARRTLDSLFDQIDVAGPLGGALVSPPRIAEVQTVARGERVLRIEAETRPSRRQELEAELRKRINVRLLSTNVAADLPA